MSEPIKPGDLVYVAHCPCNHWYGRIFRVGEILRNDSGYIRCEHCGVNHTAPKKVATNADFVEGIIYCAPLSWLKRIDPLSEQTDTETRREVTA